MNLGYTFETSVLQFNALYGKSNPPSDLLRTIHDFESNGGKYRFLFIVNDREFEFTRQRFDVLSDSENKNLFLANLGRDRERIARTSYTWNLSASQGVELGIEVAQTIRDSNLRLGLDIAGTPSPDYGNLVPVAINNSASTVEELRYEPFAAHNWQLNPRMSLESSLIIETSTIEQSGDVSNRRDFNFVRPKLDYRFDITDLALSYGLFYSNNSNDGSGRVQIDIIDIEERKNQPNLSAFIEKKAFGNITFRLDAQNLSDNEFCRTRTRFVDATAAGIVEEIEDYCSGNGLKLVLKARATF